MNAANKVTDLMAALEESVAAAKRARAQHDAPKRIQLRRSKGWRKPEGAIVCTRPGRYGNPFKGPDAVERFRASLLACRRAHTRRRQPIEMRRIADALDELRGHDLCCFCSLTQPCHVDVLLELANHPGGTHA